MDEIRLTAFAMTAEELCPILWRRQFGVWAILFFAYGLIVANGAVLLVGSSDGWWVLPIFFVGSMLLHRFWTLPREVRKMDPVIFENCQVVFDEANLSWRYDCGIQSTAPWKLVKKATVYRGIYLLTLPGSNDFALPRRALDSDQEHYLVDRLRDVKLLP